MMLGLRVGSKFREEPLMYLLWHTQRQGWISRASGTTTDVNDAQRFDRAIAVERARSQKDYTGAYMLLPVAEEDLK